MFAPPANAQTNPAAALQYEIEFPQHERLVRTRMAEGAKLAPFVSDGCSGGLSSGWSFFSATFPALTEKHGNQPPWESCCLAHDRLYHAAGFANGDAEQSFEARLAADVELRLCVIETAALRRKELAAEYGLSGRQVDLIYNAIAAVMYRAVRLGGGPCSGLPWRWGFGWPACAR
jgi:hypothetical protein